MLLRFPVFVFVLLLTQLQRLYTQETADVTNTTAVDIPAPKRDATRVVLFQPLGRATTNSYMQFRGEIPDLTSVTFCFRARLEYLSLAQSTFISYFPGPEDQLTLFYDWEANEMVLGAYSNSVRATLPETSVKLYTWMSVCLGLDFATNTFAGVIDRAATSGNLTEAERGRKRHVPGGGTLVIAQEQDKEGGLFSIGQMFSGDMAQMRMFSRVLSEEEMLSYVDCGETPEGDVLLASFEDLDEWDILGDVEVALVPDEVLCEKKKREFIVLPEQRTFSEAQKMCEKLSLPMALPESEEENNDLFKLAVNVESLCLSSYSTNVWIGAQGNLETDEWQNLEDGAKLTYDNLDKRYTYITEASRCISQGGSFYPGIWYSTFCSRFKPCTACENAPKSSIRIRGLCRDSRLDREIHVQGLKNQKPMFQGTFYANVFWDNSTWVMTSRRYPDIRARMKIAFIDDYPVGLQRWEVDGDVCPDTEMDLMMTVCGAGSFTCNDGTCVKISQRCDLQVNCDDKSDEHECDRVLLEQKLALDVIIVLQWVDSRLQYFNLQEQQSRNLVQDRTEMWQPRLVITDDTGSQVDFNERRAALVVVKESEPLPDDDTRVKEGGLRWRHGEVTISYQCQFDLRRFPFDEQQCALTFQMGEMESLLVKLRRGEEGVVYKGPKQLPEYKVSQVVMQAISSNATEGQLVTMTLTNLYRYYLGNAYVPSLLLVIICYSTFYFRVEEFGDRIMVSITAMLVLVALFSQTSSTIPRTTYLKYIDVWYMFYIVLDFIMIILLVVINYVRWNVSESNLTARTTVVAPMVDSLMAKSSRGSLKGGRTLPQLLNLGCCVLLPLINFVFTFCYVIISIGY
ncbi:CRE-MOD-1 protein [Penaeus vannamei]|uniref:CRE-MOD-1 protein n=1 Tax=Penaeus vannamei TaxID=6689 RepID=A0A423TVK8_PENVA|nr:CRE-MOD-1 protein [Penaeus vannamei]